MTAPTRYAPCAICRGDGCAACDNAGFHRVTPAWFPTQRPSHTPVTAPPGGWRLCIARDGTAATGDGEDRWTFPRWALCLSADGVRPARRYRNGGPVGVVKAVSGKRAPEWMARAVAYVATVGGIAESDAATVAEWYRTHRVGSFGAHSQESCAI